MKILFYLHGFNGSPNSPIANTIKDMIQNYSSKISFFGPDISGLNMEQIFNTIQTNLTDIERDKNPEQIIFTGVSLGGFFALKYFSTRPNSKLILINPCLNPTKYLNDMIGTHTNQFSNKKTHITPDIKNKLAQLEQNNISNQSNILLLTQQDDPRLDASDAINMLPDAKQIISSNGGHEFNNLDKYHKNIIKFCELN